MADIVCGECSEEITKDDGDTVFYCNSCKQYFHEKCVIDADGQYCPYCSPEVEEIDIEDAINDN